MLRKNPEYRKLFIGQAVSGLGDWFSQVALLGLLLDLTNSGFAVSLLFLCNSLPVVLISAYAGIVADRLNRRVIMITSDLLRAGLALGFILVHDRSDIWLAYTCTAGMFLISAFFYPAQQAAVPNLVESEDLVVANSLSGLIWGSMLAVGAAVGGWVAAVLGREPAFAINAASFLFSAAMIFLIRKPMSASRVQIPAHQARMQQALDYVRQAPEVLLLLPVKAMWSLAGGLVLLLTIFGSRIFGAGDAGIGALYSARGVGALLGPIAGQMLAHDDWGYNRRIIAFGFILTGIAYALFSMSSWLPVGLLLVFCAHVGSGALWVISNARMQQIVPDNLRGRVFSLDNLLQNLVFGIANVGAGLALGIYAPRSVGIVISCLVIVSGVVWGAVMLFWFERRHAETSVVRSV